MAYAIRYHRRVRDDLRAISPEARRRIARAIEVRLAVAPERFGAPLVGSLRGYWKLRVGDDRVAFKLVEDEARVLAIAHRRDVYDRVSRRIL